MSYPGLLCLIIKSAELEPNLEISTLGSGLAGALLGGGVGAIGGGLNGYFGQEPEVDPMTGEQKSKWGNVLNGMGTGGLIGGGIGGLVGANTGWNNKTQGWEYGKALLDKHAPGAWNTHVQNHQSPNLVNILNENRVGVQ